MSGLPVAMVLAAGRGTRMRPLTDSRPKPLIEVAGRPLIDHTLDRVDAARIGRAVVNVHHHADMLADHLAGCTRPAIALSDERAALLETGGGVAKALPLLAAEAFAVLNSDAIWAGPEPLTTLATAWQAAPAVTAALMLLVPRARALGYTRPGDFFLEEEGGIPRRRGTAAEAPLVYAGAQVLTAAAMAHPAAGAPGTAFSLNPLWDALIAEGRLRAVTWPPAEATGEWADVGTPPGIAVAEAMLARHAPMARRP
ncbi:MAG: nucleotidyltransferase family protein [Pseudomonadota bacterium]